MLAPCAALLLAATPVSPPSSCHEPAPPVAPHVLVQPAPRDARAGKARDPVTTSSREAQAAYDRGLALLHAYDWVRAARSFHEALRDDENLALAYVGLSIAHRNLGDPESARAALAKARVLGPKASERERARIEAWGAALDGLYAEAGEDRFAAFRAALDRALARWPEDSELLLWRGTAASPLPPGYGPYQSAASVPWYERVLKAQPDHPGAHHYLVHAFENEGRFEDAERHAAAFAKLAPGAPHAIHMHGHALMRTGRMKEALARFQEADRVGAAIRKAEKIADADDWHHAHNLSLLASVYRHQGRMKDAESALRRLAALPRAGDDVELERKELAAFLLARGRHREALEAANTLSKSRLGAARAVGHALAGEALLSMGRVADAGERSAKARAERDAIAGELAATRRWVASLYVDALEGLLLVKEGNIDRGRALLDRVVANHRRTQGPDAWAQALFRLERLATATREIGNEPLATHVVAELLEHDRSYGGTWVAVMALARARGNSAAGDAAEAKAREIWRDADPDLLPNKPPE